MEFSATKILAGALAAVTAATIASYFGVEGTLIGAGLASIVATVGTAIYDRSLSSSKAWMRRSLVRPAQGDEPVGSEGEPVGTEPVPARPGGRSLPAAGGSIRWQRVAAAGAIVFALALGTITAIEATANRPIASLLGAQPTHGQRTSVGAVLGGRGGTQGQNGSGATSTSTTAAPAGSATTQPQGAVPPTTAAGGSGTPTSTTPTTTTAPSTTHPAPSQTSPTTAAG